MLARLRIIVHLIYHKYRKSFRKLQINGVVFCFSGDFQVCQEGAWGLRAPSRRNNSRGSGGYWGRTFGAYWGALDAVGWENSEGYYGATLLGLLGVTGGAPSVLTGERWTLLSFPLLAVTCRYLPLLALISHLSPP